MSEWRHQAVRHLRLLIFCKTGIYRQTDRFLIVALGFREIFWPESHALVVRVAIKRNVMQIYTDTRRPHSFEDLSLNRPEIARRMCLYCGVTSLCSDKVHQSPQELTAYIVDWARRNGVLQSGGKVVLVMSTNWSAEGHDMMLVHAVP